MIYVVATIQVVAGKRAEVLAEFKALVPLVLAEEGCLEYGPTIDVATGISVQGPPRDDAFTVVERWENVEALQAHLIAPHMLTYRNKVKGLVLGTTLQVLEPA